MKHASVWRPAPAAQVHLGLFLLAALLITASNFRALGQNLDGYGIARQQPLLPIAAPFQFNGYTNHWHDVYTNEIRHGNLFKLTVPQVDKLIAQNKLDLATELGIPGLAMQEGFMNSLLGGQYIILDKPTVGEIAASLATADVLVSIDPASTAGQELCAKLPDKLLRDYSLGSHQFGAKDFAETNLFYLESPGKRKIHVVASHNKEARAKALSLIETARELLGKYDLHKGWFGAASLLKSVTCSPGHPLEVLGKAMNEGCSWATFSGYMDFLAKDEIDEWLAEVGNPVVADVGFESIHGLKDYKGLQVQSMFKPEDWINYAREKNGYVFRPVFDTTLNKFNYNGYLAAEGHKEQIDNEDVPFILPTGYLINGTENSMVLFVEKGKRLTNSLMWDAITKRREVGILKEGLMMGPALYRNTLQMMLLDRLFLEEYFGDRINIETSTAGYTLKIRLTNHYPVPVRGQIDITLPPALGTEGSCTELVELPAGGSKTVSFDLRPTAAAMKKANPIAMDFAWNGKHKKTMAMLELPRAISVQQLLYGHAPNVSFPVTIHNFTKQKTFPVKVEVFAPSNPKKPVFTATKSCTAPTASYSDMQFELRLPPGNYEVNVSALGVENTAQLGVGKPDGKPSLTEIDLNGDGIMEYSLENDSVRVTLLATGARVIEYIVKSKNDNVLFKLWPEKAADDKRSFRKRGYYPYGGFEDFLGQGSMETHKIYTAEIVKKEGDHVSVKMSAEYFGNTIEKTFTLYGNSPLLEVRFALRFKNPEANVLGPQPILELGAKHWTEDVFTIPELDGLQEYRMMPEKYYGRAFFLKEGWNAGHDTAENISFVGAFPVSEPIFLHMWMNHPSNSEAHFYYAEFQPWTPIYQKTTSYFTYYLWGSAGKWENALAELRKRNLISTNQNEN